MFHSPSCDSHIRFYSLHLTEFVLSLVSFFLFDKVWHQGIVLKLKKNGISKNLLKIIEDFLSNRYQRVVVNKQSSGWAAVNSGVLQGSILGPLLLLVYLNDLSTGLSSNPRLFADDTSLFSVVHARNTSADKLKMTCLK